MSLDWKTFWENNKVKCYYVLNQFVKSDNILLDDLNYDQKSDRDFVNANIEAKTSSGMFERPRYPFYYLCHGTVNENAHLIEEEKGFIASKITPTNEFNNCFFTWWHVYPYSSPEFDLTEEKKSTFTEEIKKMKSQILKPFGENITSKEKEELGKCLVTSGVFKARLFPYFQRNFIYSIPELLAAYKVTMNCDKLSFKKYGTFVYLKSNDPVEYYREIMYAILVCPAESEEFSELLDEADDIEDFLCFDLHQPEKVPWEWIPYSTSAGKPKMERHWDHVAFAFYLTEGKYLCPERRPISVPVLEKNLFDNLQNISAN